MANFDGKPIVAGSRGVSFGFRQPDDTMSRVQSGQRVVVPLPRGVYLAVGHRIPVKDNQGTVLQMLEVVEFDAKSRRAICKRVES